MAVAPVERARADLAAGRAWKARDRLLGAVVGYPTDQAVLELLGEVLFGLGDLPAAGRYWYLTARTGPDVDAAIEALLERSGDSSEQLARSLPLVAPLEAYPEAVKLRLDALPDHALRRREGRALPRDGGPQSRADRAAGLIIPAVGLTLVGLLVLGAVKLAELVGALLG